ncbi:rod shape-determining protein MreC [Bacillota bacterium LX-D]|nr:rod shape-determining protein MreC [Bacillota bacterium LX-D]
MARFRIKKIQIICLVLLVIGAVTVHMTAAANNFSTPVTNWIRNILAPLQSGVTIVTKGTGDTLKGLLSFKSIQAENKRLKAQIDQLTAENNQLEEYRQQDLRLRQMLRLQSSLGSNYELEAVEVISRDIKNWNKVLTINKGSANNLKVGMAVMSYAGLVGRISRVGVNTADVLLLQDRQGAVAGLIQASRFPGVVEGTTDDSGLLQMIHLPYDAPVLKNQIVITSGLGGVLPKGLRIGYIVSVKTEPDGLMKKALIKPFADFNRLEELLVVTEVKGGS